MAPKKLTQKSEAVQLLRLKLKLGDITSDMDPKAVWESNPVFKEHKLTNFRTCYNNIKKEYLEENMAESEGESLPRRLTFADRGSASKKRRNTGHSVAVDGDPSDDDDGEVGPGAEITTGERFFKPLYLLSNWKEPGTMTRRITAAVVLPSGVESGDFSICVSPNGLSLDITVLWPSPLVDLSMMHKKWLACGSAGDFQVFHPKYTGFEDALKKVRDRSSDNVQSTARIPLPFVVQTHIDCKYNLAWRESSAKMVYVEMKAFIEQYSVVNDDDEFEVL